MSSSTDDQQRPAWWEMLQRHYGFTLRSQPLFFCRSCPRNQKCQEIPILSLHLWASTPVSTCREPASSGDPLHLWAGRGAGPLKDIGSALLGSLHIHSQPRPHFGPQQEGAEFNRPHSKASAAELDRHQREACGQSASTSCSQVKSPLHPQSAGSQWEAQNL